MLLSLTALCALGAGLVAASTDDVSRWSSLATRNGGLIKLNSRTFDEILSAPRDYSVAVTLTALSPQFKCQPCRMFDGEARLLAKQWLQSPRKNEHFFASLDFPDGQEVFKRLGLQTAPNIRVYLPTEGPRASASREPEMYDISRAGPSAESFAAFLRNTAQLPVDFRRPPNYSAMATTFSLVVIIGVLGYLFWPYVSRVIFGKELWAIGTNLFIVSMTGGYMWNQIRHPPWAVPGQNGRISYIAGGMQNQYAVETQILAGVYAVLAFSVYTLVVTIPWISDPWRQRIATYIWAGVLFFMANVLVSLFKAKGTGYPFGLGLL